jgi:hypothetical protein
MNNYNLSIHSASIHYVNMRNFTFKISHTIQPINHDLSTLGNIAKIQIIPNSKNQMRELTRKIGKNNDLDLDFEIESFVIGISPSTR